MDYRVAIDLMCSARAHFIHGVEFLEADDYEARPFAVLHVAIALELLAKSRLSSVDPQLVVRSAATVTDEQFRTGAFQSIGLEEAFEAVVRLGLAHFKVPRSGVLTRLRHMRNAAVHFVEQPPTRESRKALLAAASLFLDAYEAEVASNWKDRSMFPPLYRSISVLSEVPGFAAVRCDALKPRLAAERRPALAAARDCWECRQSAVVLNLDSVTCLFCGRTFKLAEVAMWSSTDGSVGTCGNCSQHAVIRLPECADPKPPRFACLGCGCGASES